jgi:hypothetical protein
MSIQRARFAPVVLGVALLGATVALRAHAALSSHSAVSSTLHAVVREDASIGLTYDDGTDVGSQGRTPPTIPPGTYTVRGRHRHHSPSTSSSASGSQPVGFASTPGSVQRAAFGFQCDDRRLRRAATSNPAQNGGGGSGGSSRRACEGASGERRYDYPREAPRGAA